MVEIPSMTYERYWEQVVEESLQELGAFDLEKGIPESWKREHLGWPLIQLINDEYVKPLFVVFKDHDRQTRLETNGGKQKASYSKTLQVRMGMQDTTAWRPMGMDRFLPVCICSGNDPKKLLPDELDVLNAVALESVFQIRRWYDNAVNAEEAPTRLDRKLMQLAIVLFEDTRCAEIYDACVNKEKHKAEALVRALMPEFEAIEGLKWACEMNRTDLKTLISDWYVPLGIWKFALPEAYEELLT